MAKWRMLDLFSGIGGFSLAASWVWGEDLEIVAFCEIDKFCQKVLKKHWPDVPIVSDIRSLNEETLADAASIRCQDVKIETGIREEKETFDRQFVRSSYEKTTRPNLLTGGFPCQPASVAGKRKGKADDRWLWPEMFRVIRTFRPTWVIAENVYGLLTLESGMVFEHCCAGLEAEGYEVQPFIIPACAVNAPHRRDRVWIVGRAKTVMENPRSSRFGQSRVLSKQSRGAKSICTSKSMPNGADTPLSKDVADTDSGRCSPVQHTGDGTEADRRRESDPKPQSANVGDANSGRFQAQRERIAEGTAWTGPECSSWWSTEPNVGRVAHGIPARVDRLKSLGNAIVPQVAAVIMQAIKEAERG